MEELISKNPIYRFKEENLILKLQLGSTLRNISRYVPSPVILAANTAYDLYKGRSFKNAYVDNSPIVKYYNIAKKNKKVVRNVVNAHPLGPFVNFYSDVALGGNVSDAAKGLVDSYVRKLSVPYGIYRTYLDFTSGNNPGVKTNKKGHKYILKNINGKTYNIFSNGEMWDVNTGKLVGTIDRETWSLKKPNKSSLKQKTTNNSTNNKSVISSNSNITSNGRFLNRYSARQDELNGKSVIEMQNDLNEYFKNDNTYTPLKTDNIWGDKTEAAYQRYLLEKNNANSQANNTLQTNTPNTPNTTYTTATEPYTLKYNYNNSPRDISKLGFNNYAGLVNFAASNHPLAQDLRYVFGDPGKWNQSEVESALGVSGRYGTGFLGGGDYSDIAHNIPNLYNVKRSDYEMKQVAPDVVNPHKGFDFVGNFNNWSREHNYDTRFNNFNKFRPVEPLPDVVNNKSTIGEPLFAKQGGNLISKNSVERFKKKKNLIKAEGGFSFKLVTEKTKLKIEKLKAKLKKFNKSKIVTTDNFKSSTLDKARKRNKEVAELLNTLWNLGMFKDVKKNGKALKYEEAVDGSMGNMTRQALDLAKKKASNMLAHAPLFVRDAVANNSIKVMNLPIYSKTMSKQLELWDAGAFKGIINKKTGKLVTYNEAVDGKEGNMTKQAAINYNNIIKKKNSNISSNSSFSNNSSDDGILNKAGKTLKWILPKMSPVTFMLDEASKRILNNVYPYSYGDKLVNNLTGETKIYSGFGEIPEGWTLKQTSANDSHINLLNSMVAKSISGLFKKDPRRERADFLANLNLNSPYGKMLWDLGVKTAPLGMTYLNGNPEDALFELKSRLNLANVYNGQGDVNEMFEVNPDYESNTAKAANAKTYRIKDPKQRDRIYRNWRNYFVLHSGEGKWSDDHKSYLLPVLGFLGNQTLVADDEYGTNLRYVDYWDYKLNKPGANITYMGDRLVPKGLRPQLEGTDVGHTKAAMTESSNDLLIGAAKDLGHNFINLFN